MNILFLSLGKIESVDSPGIYNNLLKEFDKNNHKVYVVSPRERRYNERTELQKENNISYLKIRTGNITKTNIFEKGLTTILIERHFLRGIKKNFKDVKFDLVLYATPPITFSKIIKYIKKRDEAKSYLLLKDIFPQNAVDLGMIKKNGILYRYFRRKEKKLYQISDYIGTMSPANMNYISKGNPNIINTKIEINPNTITPLDIEFSESEIINIRKKYGLPLNKTILVYGGNLGKPQGIDFLIECIKKNEENNNSFFLIVGSGTEFKKLQKYFFEFKPKNAKLLEQLSRKDYELLANTCDVGLIFLDKRFTIPNFPSRLLSYMQAEMPVLAATDPNTDIGEIIEEGNFGFSCISDNVEVFNDLVIKLTNKKIREKMGRNARIYLENNYTSKHSYDVIMNHFK